MFSDSILIYGNDSMLIVEKLIAIYNQLLQKGLLLRGAMVNKKLNFEPRLTYDNFQKMLPDDDTLARAVGLSSTQKGARFLIEPDLARKMFIDVPDWLTHDGYVRLIDKHVDQKSILRRICPTPDNNSYEVLYFWAVDGVAKDVQSYKKIRNQLDEIRKMLREDISEHYKETVSLITRSETRQKYTEKLIKNY